MLLPGFKHWVFRPNFRGQFLYMYGSQKQILGQKVNAKFFTVDPYSVGTGVPRPFSKFANYWKNIFLKIKTSKIKSEKNIYQTIHNTRFIFYFFGIFTIFLYFSRFFTKKCIFSEKITDFFSRFHSQPGALFGWFGNFPHPPHI